MSSEYRSGQGTIIPTMFIGLGGTGSRVVDRIASRAAHLPNWESQLRPLTTFVSIDTNELDQHKLRHIPDGNRLNIAAFNKAKAIEGFRRSQDPQALQWLDRGYEPRPGFKPGAGQIRVESRLGFFYHSPEIRQRLKELVTDSLRPGITWRQASPPKYNVYVFCTLAGGTGSGSFLSTAYLIHSIIEQQNWQPRIVSNLMLSTLLLDKVGPELHSDIHANTYAALKEVEHLTKLDYAQVKREGRTFEPFVFCRDENSREVTRVSTRPFFLSFIIDRPPHLGLRDAGRAIADSAYLQIFTPIMDNLAGELDNYEKRLEELTRFPGDLKNVGNGYTKNFGAYGAAAMILPGHDLLAYCARRFAARAIRSQITFGVDRADPEDDRARALARLSVDYSDPKFLNMSDEGREKAINDAFVASVREMGRQDAAQELQDGYWYQLVESIDQGTATGSDEDGQPIRAESKLAQIQRKLDESRDELFNRISIREQRAFIFHKEGVAQYIDLVARLQEEIRQARVIVNERIRGLEAPAEEGEIVADLKLDPIAERYLVVRALKLCQSEWIPEALQQLESHQKNDVGNASVRERLERENYESLQDAASRRSLLGRNDEAFDAVKMQAQDDYNKVAGATKRTLDAEVRLRQLRALVAYLERRSRQYSRLATRMDSLVQDLERDAERLRRGESSIVPNLALRVEVFETLDEPRQRIWDRVYQRLFIDGGRYISTFDRQSLAETITGELKPVVRADGSVVDKGLDTTVADLRRALVDLGEGRTRPTLVGDAEQPGLDLVQGLELEARLILEPKTKPGEEVSNDDIEAYREKKFRALAQISGVLARVSSADSKALDDGVTVNRTRQLIHGLGGTGGSEAGAAFVESLKSILLASGRTVNVDTWHDPRLAIVHDVELAIPLYYVEPINHEIENAYLNIAADENRSYNLHTDFNWEKSLPNLNPRRSEITVGWSLRALAEGVLAGVLKRENGLWVWPVDERNEQKLGTSLSSALYRLGEIHRRFEDLPRKLEEQIARGREALGENGAQERREELAERFRAFLRGMESRELDGSLDREDVLDKPILRALVTSLTSPAEWRSTVAGNAPSRDRYSDITGF